MKKEKESITYVPVKSNPWTWIIVYAVEAIAFVVSIIFDGLWAEILYKAILCLLLLTLALHAFLQSVAKNEKIRTVIFFGVNLLLLAYLFLFFNRFWPFVCVACEFCLAVFCLALWLNAQNKGVKFYSNGIVVGVTTSMLLISMTFFMRLDIVDYTFALWLLLPAVVVGIVAAFLIFGTFRDLLYAALGQTSELVAFALLVPVAVYMFSFVAVVSINYSFDGTQPVAGQYEVVEKHVSSGARQVTSYTLNIVVDGKKRDIGVSKGAYNQTEEGDTIEVAYYGGALGIGYYVYVPVEELS